MIIYTVITNNYDELRPVTSTDEVTYVCFTDDLNIPSNGWELRLADKHNRWYKFSSHILFPKEEITIYIDGHGQLTKTPQEIVKILGDANIGQQLHPTRKCLYQEANAVFRARLDEPGTIKYLVDKYRADGFPDDYGLFANGCIVRRKSEDALIYNEVTKYFMETEDVKRDQLLTQYVVWKSRLSIKPIQMFVWGGHKRR